MSVSYEMMYILRPDLSEERVEQEIQKYRDFITEYGAEEIEIQNRGKRRLAYPIIKYQDGIYIQMNYNASGKQVAPLEKAMGLSDEVIRYLTMKVKNRPTTPEETSTAEEESQQNQN
ncbi:MAG: 30S ribosomal protein S6 [Prochloron sp. SP5CPC1]|nr:30S ribosomal protein S6 [Candidatus Paraprochloron terpiosi SP5CPC1]